MIGKIAAIAALLGLVTAGDLYDPNHSDITMYTKLNWDKQVGKNREKGISIVHFYKSSGKLKYVSRADHVVLT